MNVSRFDGWTRRGIGLTVGSLTLALLGVRSLETTEASKKKRCKRLGDTCTPGGKRKCCGELRCAHHGQNSVDQTFCCKIVGKPCREPNDCCTPAVCFDGICRVEK